MRLCTCTIPPPTAAEGGVPQNKRNQGTGGEGCGTGGQPGGSGTGRHIRYEYSRKLYMHGTRITAKSATPLWTLETYKDGRLCQPVHYRGCRQMSTRTRLNTCISTDQETSSSPCTRTMTAARVSPQQSGLAALTAWKGPCLNGERTAIPYHRRRAEHVRQDRP